MKKFLILILIFSTKNIFSQNKETEQSNTDRENQIHKAIVLETKPEFPGGLEEFYKFISDNYIVPKEKPASVKGKVYATFVIEKDGNLSDIKIIKDVGFNTGNEFKRVLKLSPKWSPGKNRNKEVRVLYTIPIDIN